MFGNKLGRRLVLRAHASAVIALWVAGFKCRDGDWPGAFGAARCAWGGVCACPRGWLGSREGGFDERGVHGSDCAHARFLAPGRRPRAPHQSAGPKAWPATMALISFFAFSVFWQAVRMQRRAGWLGLFASCLPRGAAVVQAMRGANTPLPSTGTRLGLGDAHSMPSNLRRCTSRHATRPFLGPSPTRSDLCQVIWRQRTVRAAAFSCGAQPRAGSAGRAAAPPSALLISLLLCLLPMRSMRAPVTWIQM